MVGMEWKVAIREKRRQVAAVQMRPTLIRHPAPADTIRDTLATSGRD
jgi:hypothetical protein